MALSQSCLALIPIFLTLFLQVPPLAYATRVQSTQTPPSKSLPDVVEKVCFHTKNPDPCDRIFRDDPRSSLISNLTDVAELVIDIATSLVLNARANLRNKLRSLDFKPEHGPAIELCLFSYNKVLEALKMSLKQQSKNVKIASYGTLVAEDFTRYCQLALDAAGVKIPSVRNNNAMLKLLVSILDSTNRALDTKPRK